VTSAPDSPNQCTPRLTELQTASHSMSRANLNRRRATPARHFRLIALLGTSQCVTADGVRRGGRRG
jgi:hypothetical protein